MINEKGCNVKALAEIGRGAADAGQRLPLTIRLSTYIREAMNEFTSDLAYFIRFCLHLQFNVKHSHGHCPIFGMRHLASIQERSSRTSKENKIH